MSDKPTCPACESADTVSFWDIEANKPENQKGSTMRMAAEVFRMHYADIRVCVDCECQWRPSDVERMAAMRKLVLGGRSP